MQVVGSADPSGNRLDMKVAVRSGSCRGCSGWCWHSAAAAWAGLIGQPHPLCHQCRRQPEQAGDGAGAHRSVLLEVAGGTVRGTSEVIGSTSRARSHFNLDADHLDLDKILPPPERVRVGARKTHAASSSSTVPSSSQRLEMDGKIAVVTGG